MTILDSGFLMENGGSCLPVPPEEEGRVVAELYRESEARLKEGDVFYVLSSKYVVVVLLASLFFFFLVLFGLFGVIGALPGSMARGLWVVVVWPCADLDGSWIGCGVWG